MDAYIEDVAATCDHVRALGGHDKRIMISFDEWNVTSNGHGDPGTEPSGEDWPVAPRFAESTYTAQDAVVVGSLLISLLRHTDRVASASQAQLRSEEHTSELQSRGHLVCRLLLEKKNNNV